MRPLGLESTTAPGVYVHVPFCAHTCDYCAFYSELLDPVLLQRYVEAICSELRMLSADSSPRTLFFGGGTPSILPIKQWEMIIATIHELGWVDIDEWTVECNPATVSKDKASLLKQAGVNRVSMGIQSLHEDLLDGLGRVHSRDQVFRSYDILRDVGFENVNLDLMFAIPFQTMDIWRETLHEVFTMSSEHLSCYEVIYEDDTALFQQLKAGKFAVDEDLSDQMYATLVGETQKKGFQQYEIANFAKETDTDKRQRYPSRASRHNINYWEGGDYHGVGPAATEYLQGHRRKHWANTQIYCDQVDLGKRGLDFEETLEQEAQMGEAAAFSLRMNAGIDLVLFRERYGVCPVAKWSDTMHSLQSRGWATLDEDSFRLNAKGMRFADEAGSAFVFVEN